MQTHSPDPFFIRKNPGNRRVKSEIPKFFKEASNTSIRQLDSKKSILKDQCYTKSSNKLDDILLKHREIILEFLKNLHEIPDSLLSKLKEITSFPDLLSDVIFKKLRGDSLKTRAQSEFSEELTEYKKFASNLQTQLIKAKQSNEELTSMLLSVEVQQKLSVTFI